MNPTSIPIIYEDNHLLVVNKPAGMLTQGDETGDRSLVEWAKDYRIRKENKPGNAYIGPVHRIDRPVSGIVVLAKTTKAAGRISQQFQSQFVEKIYWAIIEPKDPKTRQIPANPSQSTEIWEDSLLKNSEKNVVRIVSRRHPKGKRAITGAKPISQFHADGRNWIQYELSPKTGRSHQLRCQAAFHIGAIAGDAKYGSTYHLDGWIALHAYSFRLEHPTTKSELLWTAKPPENWRVFGKQFEE